MKLKKVTFQDIIDAYTGDPKEVGKKVDELSKRAPLPEPILDMFANIYQTHRGQPYRQPQIWPGDEDSTTGQGMAKVDPKAPLLMCISTIEVDPHSGTVAIGRIFSGSVREAK